MADPYTYTGEEEERGWSDGDELERKPPADDDADDGHLGDTATDDDEGQDTLDLHDMTLLTQQQQDPSDRGDAYSTDDGYHQQQHLLTQEGVDADDGGYHDDDLGSVSDGYILMNNGDDDGVGISSSDGEGDSGDDTSRSGSSSSGDGSDDDDDDDDDSSSDDSDESVTQLEKDLRAVDATASPAGGTPRIIRNRRRAIARNKERLRLLMEGVERPGAPVAGPDGGDTTAENGNAIVDNAKQRGKKKKRSGRTGRKSKSPGKGCSGKTGKRRGMLFPTRYNAVEPSSVLAAGSTSTTKAAAASPIGLSQSSECSASTPATQQQQTYKSIAEEVGNRFPHREAQIRLLCSVFERTMQQTGGAIGVDGTTTSSSSRRPTASDDISTSSDGTFVPSPVFVTGPSGVGKTSVIRDILQCLKRRHADTSSSSILSPSLQKQQKQKPSIAKAGGVGMGYIDCSSMEGSTAGAFLEEAYKQILRSFFSSSSRKPSRRSRKRKRHGALSPKRQMNDGTNANVTNGGGAPAPDANSKEVRSSTNQSAGRNGGQNGTSALQNQDETKPPAIDNGNEKLTAISPAKAPASRHTPLDDEEIDPMIGHDDEEEGFGDIEDQIEQQKKEHLRTKIAAQQSGGLVAGGAGGERSEDSTLSARRHHAITTPADFGRALLPLCGGPDDLVSKSRYCGCAFLVVDHADRLLSMTAKQNSPYNAISKDERNNLLSQLLLLPRVMGLNLTIVVLTTNSLLEFGRTNNVHMQPSSSLGTIQDAIHPMRVRFHAYRGKLIYRSILLQPSIKDVVIGCSRRNSRETRNMCPGSQRIINIARDRLYNAMIKTILQSLEGMTRDIREIQRFARIFWPIYISPLTTGHAQDPNGVIKQKFCLVLASSGNTQAQKGQEDDPSPGLCRQETCGFCRAVVSLKVPPSGRIDSILEMLDIKGRKPMREIISKCLFAPVQKLDTTAYPETNQDATFLRTVRDLQGSSLAQLSYMAKFLLLSAYLCQKNRQEQDLALFTHHNKGRRRKTSSEGNNADGEGALFASSAIAQQQLRSFRLVGFPLERMISVFSSILSKYGSESEFLRGKIQQDGYLNVTEVGSTQLFACLAELRDFGLLCDMNGGLSANVAAGTGHIDMAAKKYTCNLADADATALANELEIPLQKYLLQEN